MDGRDALESDEEIEELKRGIRALLFVTKLSRVDAHKDKATGWGATLKCASCPGCCGRRQEAPVQLSRDRKTEIAFLQELLKRLQDRHVDCAEALTKKAAADAQAAAAVSADTPRVLEAMMLFQQAKKHAQAAQDRAKATQDQVKAAKKVALEAEKDNDAAQKELQELQRVMEPKRPRTNATTANDLEECAGHCRALLYAKVQLLV